VSRPDYPHCCRHHKAVGFSLEATKRIRTHTAAPLLVDDGALSERRGKLEHPTAQLHQATEKPHRQRPQRARRRNIGGIALHDFDARVAVAGAEQVTVT
jgi:hypothetical protein